MLMFEDVPQQQQKSGKKLTVNIVYIRAVGISGGASGAVTVTVIAIVFSIIRTTVDSQESIKP